MRAMKRTGLACLVFLAVACEDEEAKKKELLAKTGGDASTTSASAKPIVPTTAPESV